MEERSVNFSLDWMWSSWSNKYSQSLTLTTVDKIVMCKHKTEDNISNNEQKEIKGPRKQSIYLTTSEQ